MSDRVSPESASPYASSERSPKRRRLESSCDRTPGYSSPDELGNRSNYTPRPQPPSLRSHGETPDSEERTYPNSDGQTNVLDKLHPTFYREEHARPGSPSASLSRNTSLQPSAPNSPPLTPSSLGTQVAYRQKLILRGHKKGVSGVKFSPNGKWIASCSADCMIKVWDATTGKLASTLEGHLAGISTIAWSPDSSTIASGSDDKSIRLWDIQTAKPYPAALIGHHNYIYSIAFSPKGNMLVSGSYDEAVFLWDVRSGRIMRKLPAHSDPVGGVDFIRDGSLVASCAGDGLIRIWDTATGQCLRTLVHEDNAPVTSVSFSPNGKFVLAWTLDSCVRLWNYIDGRCVKTYQGHKNRRYSISGAFGTYGPNAFVVSGSEDGSILIWDVKSKALLQKTNAHESVVLGIDTHPTEQMIVSCGLDTTIRLWRNEQTTS